MSIAEQTWTPTEREYHSDFTRISNSMCEVFRRSRKEFYQRFITGEMKAPEPTPAMRLGSLFHQKVLEPEKWSKTTAVQPQADGRTKEGKAIKENFAEACKAQGWTNIITREESELLNRMTAEVFRHPYARKYLTEDGQAEHVVTWFNDGLNLKARRDYVTADVIIDLKTCMDASPGGFAKAIANQGYHRQAAHYMESESFCGGTGKPFVFIAVEKQEPFEVGVYTLDGEALTLAVDQNVMTRTALAQCLEDHSRFKTLHERGVAEISLPKWTKYEDDYLTGA